MAAPTPNSALRKQAVASIDAVATEIQQALLKEVDLLRGSLTARLESLERVLIRDQSDPAFDQAIQQLCDTAAEHSAAASAWARAQAEEAAARQLAAVQAQAQATLNDAREQLNDTQERLNDARERCDATCVDLEARLKKAEAATADALRALGDLQTHAQADKHELEQRVAYQETLKNEADSARATAERLAAAVREEADATAASLAEARGRIDALDQARTEALLAKDIAQARLEGEGHHRNAIAAELEAARSQALKAKADADASRLELQHTKDRLRAFEDRGQTPDTNLATSASHDTERVLARVRFALQRLSSVTTGRDMLDAVLELLAAHFSRVAVFAVAQQGLTVWGSRGFEPPLHPRKTFAPRSAESPLARALAEWKPSSLRLSDGVEPSGLSGGPVSFAIALPVIAKDRCTVMLYAENPPDSSEVDASVATTIAEILADHLGRRLSPRRVPSAASAPPQTPVRQAPRVKVQDGTHVAVDGTPSQLVDLSTLGAQVVSPRAIRPNRFVQLLLPSDGGGLPCEARVVWVLVEQNQGDDQALYRAGVQFTDVDAPEFEAFFRLHGLVEPAIRH